MLNVLRISERPFWDIDLNLLDEQKDALFIIQRVLEYGLWEELLLTVRFYGQEKVIEAVKQAPYLSNKTLNFCCVWLDIKPEDCKCYTKKQYNQAHWNY
jgi:hypothetical protein